MKIIKPVSITDSKLISSNVAETDYTEWNSGTSYVIGNTIMVTTTDIHYVFICMVANTNKYPPTNLYDNSTDPVTGYWVAISKTNKWKMFDNATGSQTENINSINIEIELGEIFNSIGLFNINGKTAQIILTDPVEGEVYNETIELIDVSDVYYYYEWFFLPLVKLTEVLKIDLPAYVDATLNVIITNTGETVKIGELSVGLLRDIGVTEYGSSLGIIDYSRKETDDYGNVIIEQRRYAERIEYNFLIDTYKISSIKRFISEIRATPCIFIGDENLEETIIFGFYKDFEIVLNNLNKSSAFLEVEELS